MPPNTTPMSTHCQVFHCHSVRATTSNSAVVMRNVAVTATPYAVASRAEEPNVSTTSSTAANRSQLTRGT